MRRLKLARPDLILAVVAILGLLLCGYLIYGNMGQAQRQASLEQRLSQTSAQLREILRESQDLDELKAKEARLRSEIDGMAFATEVQGKGMTLYFLEQAQGSGVTIDRLLLRQGKESVGEATYPAYRYSLIISGQPAALAVFMASLTNSPVSSMVMEGLEASTRDSTWEMKLEITVYIQPG